MAKSTGLGDNCYVDGRDLSGDIGSLGRIAGGLAATQAVTGIDKSAYERIGLGRDASLEFTAFFNKSAGQAHPTLSTLPTTDRIVSYFRGTAIGAPAASLIGKQIGYDPSRAADGSLTLGVQALANGRGLEWGTQLTAGVQDEDTSGVDAGIDFGASSSLGLQLYLHVFAFTGTSVFVGLDHSDDDADTDPYAAIGGGVLETEVSSAPQAVRLQTSRTQEIKRWIRVYHTGTFSQVSFAIMIIKNAVPVVF